MNVEKEKLLAASEAVKLIQNGQTIGLGTGSTVYYAIKEIGELVKQGLKIRCVSTSVKTSELATKLGIPTFRYK
ncbi:MAG: hypothetical protein H7223_10435 [Pedobacter sp.]|nr:hypothetical protein [Pedobacter sp.]